MIEVANVLVVFVALHIRIAGGRIVVIEVANVLVVFVALHVGIFGPVVGILSPRTKAGDHKGGRGSKRQ